MICSKSRRVTSIEARRRVFKTAFRLRDDVDRILETFRLVKHGVDKLFFKFFEQGRVHIIRWIYV